MTQETVDLLAGRELVFTDKDKLSVALSHLAQDGILWRIGTPIGNVAECLFRNAKVLNKSTVVLLHKDFSRQPDFLNVNPNAVLCYSIR